MSFLPASQIEEISLVATNYEEIKVVLEAGCDDFIRKALHQELLLEKISQHLNLTYIYEQEIQQSPFYPLGMEKVSDEVIAFLSFMRYL